MMLALPFPFCSLGLILVRDAKPFVKDDLQLSSLVFSLLEALN